MQQLVLQNVACTSSVEGTLQRAIVIPCVLYSEIAAVMLLVSLHLSVVNLFVSAVDVFVITHNYYNVCLVHSSCT